MRVRHATLGLVLGLGACDGCRKSTAPDPDARAQVTVDTDSVRIDGVRVAGRGELAPRAPTRVMPLFDELKARKETWKAAHAGLAFPGAADLVVPADATCNEVENLLRTLAYAGYPHIVFDPGSAALNVDSWVPSPPPMDPPDADPPLPMQVHFRADGKVALSRTCTGAKVIVEASAVPAAAIAVPADVIRFGCDEGVAFSAVRPTLAALRTARATRLDDDECGMTTDGGVPAHVLSPHIGLSGLGGGEPLVHRPGTLGAPVVKTQGIDVALANAALTPPRLAAIGSCFEDKRSEPRSAGLANYDGDSAEIDLVVAGDGGVARVGRGGVGSELDLCIGLTLASITFPPFDAATATITYRFVFKDSKK